MLCPGHILNFAADDDEEDDTDDDVVNKDDLKGGVGTAHVSL